LLTAENRDAEEIYLGLRTRTGLAIDESELPVIETWRAAGWAEIENIESSSTFERASIESLHTSSTLELALASDLGSTLNANSGELPNHYRLRLTPTGWLRLDSIAADLASRRANSRKAAVSATPSHCYI
jgi:hypothetical protein